LLPLGFSIPRQFEPTSQDERARLRKLLDLPAERQILLSVSALNRQKRIGYLVEEVARLPEPRPYLLLLGHAEAETAGLRALAARQLGERGHAIRTVASHDVPAFYRASDVFVLASLGESFGRVLVEAMAHGLPCLAHDYAVTRYVLGGHGFLADLSKAGALASLLDSVDRFDSRRAAERHRFVYENFSWDRLRPAYVEFLRATAGVSPTEDRTSLANNTVSSSSGEHVWTKYR
jgi:glycosyltransferase involved in cell wall biosynthesis